MRNKVCDCRLSRSVSLCAVLSCGCKDGTFSLMRRFGQIRTLPPCTMSGTVGVIGLSQLGVDNVASPMAAPRVDALMAAPVASPMTAPPVDALNKASTSWEQSWGALFLAIVGVMPFSKTMCMCVCVCVCVSAVFSQHTNHLAV